jgi:hypothetical protein
MVMNVKTCRPSFNDIELIANVCGENGEWSLSLSISKANAKVAKVL